MVSGGRLLLASREQLRRAVGFEEWDPSAEDIAALRSAEKLIAEGNTEDARQDGPPEGEPADPSVDVDHVLAGITAAASLGVAAVAAAIPSDFLPAPELLHASEEPVPQGLPDADDLGQPLAVRQDEEDEIDEIPQFTAIESQASASTAGAKRQAQYDSDHGPKL